MVFGLTSAIRALRTTPVFRTPLASMWRPPLCEVPARGMASKRHKAVRRMAKGYRGKRKNCYRVSMQAVERAMQNQYRTRKLKKREMRATWIQRINSALRQYGERYSRFIPMLKERDIELDRKILAELAVTEPYSFRSVLEVTRSK